MRLLNIDTLAIENLDDIKRQHNIAQVPYAIISHRWLEPEVTFDDLYGDIPGFKQRSQDPSWAKARSANKLRAACRKASEVSKDMHLPFKHIWLDCVCINKKDPAELSENINSMYRFYQEATFCFVYLYDYRIEGKGFFHHSQIFSRGWTLQELVASKSESTIFFDQDWNKVGNKITLSRELQSKTGIPHGILTYQGHGARVGDASISCRMSWFGGRETTKGEDAAYCLMGLFGVNMPLLYGEGGERAFRRLQEEILKYSDDHTLFAWVDPDATDDGTSPSSPGYGLLARRPACFRDMGKYSHQVMTTGLASSAEPYSLTNKGLSISLRMFQKEDNVYVATLDCPVDDKHCLGIFLKQLPQGSNQYARIYPGQCCKVAKHLQGQLKKIFVKQPLDF
ncbi:HET-domain-containing protein [Xylariaceae sp. FL0255]|nr:HET-domain-containing protein [Xylariaceae sp. FL0255]